MANIEDGFQKVLADFQKKLRHEELAAFKLTTLDDLKIAAQGVQDAQKKGKTARNLTRIQPFLQAMAQYQGVIEVFLNASDLLCFVWGPMKFMLLVASNWEKSFDILLNTYKELAENFPLLMQYRSMFASENNKQMQQILVWIYEDILNFHLKALRVFTQHAWKQLFSATWKNFQENTKPILNDLLRHRELIERTANLQQIQESRDARLLSQASFAALEKEQNHNKIRMISTWLSATDSTEDQDTFAMKRQDVPGSGSWILKEPKILAWLDPDNCGTPVLWLNGKPGAGKTILASVIIEGASVLVKASSKSDHQTTISMTYFYCREKDRDKNTFASVAKALLAQLLKQNSDKPEFLAYLYDECLKNCKPTLKSQQDCSVILKRTLNAFPRSFIIIDGLDECESKERKTIMKLFLSIINENSTEPGKLRCFFISQDLNDIRLGLKDPDVLHLTEKHVERDIENYAVWYASQIENKHTGVSQGVKDYIIKLVCEGSDGMFLFAKLVLKNLYAQPNLKGLYAELRPDLFPKGLEKAYSRILSRILENSEPVQQQTARKLLGWIVSVKRPLKWQEIQGAFSIDVISGQVNFESRRLAGDIGDICGSLVEVSSSNRVQLVHSSARHFLIQSQTIDEGDEEKQMSLLCLKYLSFDSLNPDITADALKKHLMEGDYAFLEYATLHWNHHLESAIKSLKPDGLLHLSVALNDFIEFYGPESSIFEEKDKKEYEKVRKDYIQRCEALQTSECHESLVSLLSHAKVSRLLNEQLEALGPPGVLIKNLRLTLEEFTSPQALDVLGIQKLQEYFGDKWHKCPHHSCYYFHEGFTQKSTLLQHTNKHDQPFCCTEAGCTRMYIGWSTEKELKSHMSRYHPDPDAFAWKFPPVTKLPTIFKCDQCPKQFSRANILSTHRLRVHERHEKRDHVCEHCGKGFVRNYELVRHKTIHP